MTATDELRRMLDERGVEWGNIRNDGFESDYLTEWQFDGIEGHAIATEWAVGQHLTVCIAQPMTPEQAVTATLGNDGVGRTNDGLADLQSENTKLRERITTQKQTIQAYRDESREWREVAERAQAENAKLRELVRFIMHQCNDGNPRCSECIGWNDGECVALQRMRELGVEVDG